MLKSLTVTVLLGIIPAVTAPLYAQGRESAVVRNSSLVLDEIMRIPAKGIPRSLLARAHGIVVIPGLVKGGFIVGVRHGRGVALSRNKKGEWNAPRMVEMTGGSIGFQAGIQSTDVILVFMTKKSVTGLLRGKLTIGADASAAVGPVGRKLSVATDERLRAEIYSYSRSRGLFAGVSFAGSSIQPDDRAERAFYGTKEERKIPESSLKLMKKVAMYSGSSQIASEATKSTTDTRVVIRKKLADSAAELSTILPDEWRKYLALPSEVYGSEKHPSVDSLKYVRSRFDKIAKDSKYKVIAESTEFQNTHAIIAEYVTALTSKPAEKLKLPPPPKK